MSGFEFNTVPRIVVAPGASQQLAAELSALGVSRPLLVTDPGLVSIGLIQPVADALAEADVTAVLFDQVREDPPEHTVMAAVQLARESTVDGVLAVGGGSSMDVAKVVAVLLGGDQPLQD
ncbi:MAG: iron-containing alcohol dehydrogenase, partial [Halieaceae bacterium]|nr:iron-containing alcohol dehydrogenase [Halieaceae bacterium]